MEEVSGVAITVGTTHASIGVLVNNRGEYYEFRLISTIPCIVAFKDNERYVGEDARKFLISDPRNTIFGIKRLIGRNYFDVCLRNDLNDLPFNIVFDEKKKLLIEVDSSSETKRYAPEEIYAMIIMKLKEEAESVLDTKITNVVMTVPAHFDDEQRTATRDAALIAGLYVLRIINEPTAACIAYDIAKSLEWEPNMFHYLIFRLGGYSYDITLMGVDSGVYEILATEKDDIGGCTFDDILVQHFSSQFESMYKTNIRDDVSATYRLRTTCKDIKEQLSCVDQITTSIDDFVDNINFELKITRSEFESMTKHLMLRCMNKMDSVLQSANISATQISSVVLSGSSSKIPMVFELMEKHFGEKIRCSIDPNTVIAHGAAKLAEVISPKRNTYRCLLCIIDIPPHTNPADPPATVTYTPPPNTYTDDETSNVKFEDLDVD